MPASAASAVAGSGCGELDSVAREITEWLVHNAPIVRMIKRRGKITFEIADGHLLSADFAGNHRRGYEFKGN